MPEKNNQDKKVKAKKNLYNVMDKLGHVARQIIPNAVGVAVMFCVTKGFGGKGGSNKA